MKRLFILLCCAIIGFNALAQSSDYKPISKSEQTQLLQKLSHTIQSLQCQFVQEKSSTMLADVVRSNGQLSFVAPNRLCWEYTHPSTSKFIYNNGQVVVFNSKGERVKQNTRMVQEMSRMILGIVSGNSFENAQQFKVECFSNQSLYKVVLQPINSRLKSMMQQIELWVNPKTYIATKIIMYEAGGDTTTIKFIKPQVNQIISDSLFKIN